MVVLLLFLVWLSVPVLLLWVGVFRRRGRQRIPWLGAAGLYVVALMILPTVAITGVAEPNHGAPRACPVAVAQCHLSTP